MEAVLRAAISPATLHSPLLLVVILLAALGTVSLFALGLVVFLRRPTLRYLLVTVALGALVFRTAVGLGTVFGAVPMPVHHLIEHGVDFLIAVLILAAVYRSRSSPESIGD